MLGGEEHTNRTQTTHKHRHTQRHRHTARNSARKAMKRAGEFSAEELEAAVKRCLLLVLVCWLVCVVLLVFVSAEGVCVCVFVATMMGCVCPGGHGFRLCTRMWFCVIVLVCACW